MSREAFVRRIHATLKEVGVDAEIYAGHNFSYWGGIHSCGNRCGRFFYTDVRQVEEFRVLVCSCAERETGCHFKLDCSVA